MVSKPGLPQNVNISNELPKLSAGGNLPPIFINEGEGGDGGDDGEDFEDFEGSNHGCIRVGLGIMIISGVALLTLFSKCNRGSSDKKKYSSSLHYKNKKNQFDLCKILDIPSVETKLK